MDLGRAHFTFVLVVRPHFLAQLGKAAEDCRSPRRWRAISESASYWRSFWTAAVLCRFHKPSHPEKVRGARDEGRGRNAVHGTGPHQRKKPSGLAMAQPKTIESSAPVNSAQSFQIRARRAPGPRKTVFQLRILLVELFPAWEIRYRTGSHREKQLDVVRHVIKFFILPAAVSHANSNDVQRIESVGDIRPPLIHRCH